MAEKRRASGVPGRSLSLVPTLTTDKVNGKSENRVIINVGGVKYETYKSTLKNLPDTRLSWITETTAQNSDYDPETKEYFFDRHPGVFNMVLNYYRTGKLHAPTDVCGPMFEEELAFWGIDEKQIEACCWMTYRTHRDAEETLAELDGFGDEDSDEEEAAAIAMRFGITEDDRPTQNWWEMWRPRLWKMLEEPYSSIHAKVVAAISIIFVLLSICIFTLETCLPFRRPINDTITINNNWSVNEINALTEPLPALTYLDYVSVAYFTIEFFIRLVLSPNKADFFKTGLNWVDIASLVPFYLAQILIASGTPWMDMARRQTFKFFRLVRIFRIFKLTRHFSGLKILGHTVRASAKEMILLIMFLVIFILIFACLVYLCETIDEHPLNYFKNIPIGLWWACVTMTTLGYGDIYPRTIWGYLVGGICAVAGVLVLALPVPVIVNNFSLYYSHAQARLKLPKKNRRVLVGAADMLKTQSGMPGESFAESGQVGAASPVKSRESSAKSEQRKNSVESVRTVDSGFKTGDSNGSGSSGGISVVFTDETSVADSTKTFSDSPLNGSTEYSIASNQIADTGTTRMCPRRQQQHQPQKQQQQQPQKQQQRQQQLQHKHSGVELNIFTVQEHVNRPNSANRGHGVNHQSHLLLPQEEPPGTRQRNSLQLPSVMADIDM